MLKENSKVEVGEPLSKEELEQYIDSVKKIAEGQSGIILIVSVGEKEDEPNTVRFYSKGVSTREIAQVYAQTLKDAVNASL